MSEYPFGPLEPLEPTHHRPDHSAEYYLRPRKSFAFNLEDEVYNIRTSGPEYFDNFNFNAYTYASEAYGKVQNMYYEHDLRIDRDGYIHLYMEKLGVDALESYKEPLKFKTGLPDWYLERVQRDTEAVERIEDLLTEAYANGEDPGVIVDLSPAQYDVSMEELKKNGFGAHSFARLHMIKDGKLISVAVRNYLDDVGQRELFEKLTGLPAGEVELMGRAEKINLPITDIQDRNQMAFVQGIINDIYERTPEHWKIRPMGEDQFFTNQEIVKSIIHSQDKWLKDIFIMMMTESTTESGELTWDTKQEIQRQFRGWENGIRAKLELHHELKKDHSMAEIMEAIQDELPDTYVQRQDFNNREYEMSFLMCGGGSGGFGIDNIVFGQFNEYGSTTDMVGGGLFNYKSLTGDSDKGNEGDCPAIECQHCHWKAKEKDVAEIQAGRMTECPKCHRKP